MCGKFFGKLASAYVDCFRLPTSASHQALEISTINNPVAIYASRTIRSIKLNFLTQDVLNSGGVKVPCHYVKYSNPKKSLFQAYKSHVSFAETVTVPARSELFLPHGGIVASEFEELEGCLEPNHKGHQLATSTPNLMKKNLLPCASFSLHKPNIVKELYCSTLPKLSVLRGFAIPSLFYRGEEGEGGGGFDLEKIEQMLKDSPVIEIGTVPPPYLGQPVILPRVKRSSTTSRGTFLREQEYTIANLPQPF
uniref:Uncharacterized protein n=1 Tax=Timema bartmani TaxID=61472 RepID=A0A7R9EUA8_9NEOP|nr:unnamed protein product [Timema bartmani]